MTRCYLNIAIISFALLLRLLVGIHPHSGQDDYQGPITPHNNSNMNKVKYGGDYEAQRHWMELTYHLPINEWYYHDLQYWGLDYPPLTAYVSWMFGFVAHHVGSFHDNKFIEEEVIINEVVCQLEDEACIEDQESTDTKERRYNKGLGVLKDLVALQSSRWGFEDSRGKLYMRFTVLISDLLIYISAVWVIAGRLTKQEGVVSINRNRDIIPTYREHYRQWLLLTALSQPALILIDHGHFQYNTISLGLALWSFHFISSSTNELGPIVGSILFSLALNFKQMELYHAPAVFAYLFGRCVRHANRYTDIIANFIALGVTVILTFAILWLPFVIHPPSDAISNFDGVLQIIKRVFPFQRGLFEGKVANIWCALSIKPFSIRNRIPENLLPLAALALTLVLILPPCWMLFKVGRGDKLKPLLTQPNDDNDIRLLLWGTASTSLAFFLASFQVHEKGILIPLSSISLLMLNAPDFVYFFSIVATWSLWPLLVIDRLTDAYICCLGIFLCINSMMRISVSDDRFDIFSKRYITTYVPTLALIVMIILHISELIVAPPSHLPDLYPVLWSFVGCGLFCLSYLATVWAMFAQIILSENGKKAKKKAKSKTSRMSPISLLGLILLSSYANKSDAFIQQNNVHTSYTHYSIHASSEKDAVSSLFTDDLIERARRPLSWEEKVAKEKKPVLNLSAVRNLDTLSLADGADIDENMSSVEEETGEETEDWIDGHIWRSTEQHLIDIGMGTEKILSSAPQLLRLPTQQVIEAVNFLHSYPTGTNSTDLIKADPSLLTYLADDLRYGLEEYLPNMMFMGKQDTAALIISNQFVLSPSMGLQLIRMGIEGGLEERHISRTLSSAGTASSKATEGIVGEVGKSFKQLQSIKGKKG